MRASSSLSRTRHALRIGLVALAVAALPRAAAATTALTLCTAVADPCELRGPLKVTPGSTLDFGSRAFRITDAGNLIVDGGDTLTILARAFTMRAGGQITTATGSAVGSHVIVRTTGGSLEVQRAGRPRAKIDVSADTQGGQIELSATGGDVDVAGDLFARGTTLPGNGGTVAITGDSKVSVSGDVVVTGRQNGAGGSFSIDTSGAVVMTGNEVDVTGGDPGGSITLAAGPSLSVGASLNANGTAPASNGGSVSITAGGAVTIEGPIFVQGTGSLTDGGSGGEVTVQAGGTLALDGRLNASGGPPFGDGGQVTLTAGVDLLLTEPLVADGGDGLGGDVELAAGQHLALSASIDVHGGDAGVGGDVDARAGTLLEAAAEINTNGGDGGSVFLSTILVGQSAPTLGSAVSVAGTLRARGGLTGLGGSVALQGCDLHVLPAGMLIVAGLAGAQNLLQASGQMTVEGRLTATPGGENSLEYRELPPVLTGSTIAPLPLQSEVPTLPECVPVVPVCGDNAVQTGEECDDGNHTDCDGCDGSCLSEGCPNGRVECGEPCDDGNLIDGDGCDVNCTTTVCGNHIVTAGEECDDGNRLDADGCSANCEIEPPPGCGDGNPDPGEECDDGNNTSCDGCSKTCADERCGNNIPECTEECDQGGTVCNGCSATCRIERCGDGIAACGEGCDAGAANGMPGSGCNVRCELCTLGSGAECPCGDDLDCHPLGRCAGAACQAGLCVSVPAEACGPGPCTMDAGCDDGNPCNGAERCAAGACVAGTPLDCSDGDDCTADTCDAGRCLGTPEPGVPGARCRLTAVETVARGAGVTPTSALGKKLSRLMAAATAKLERAAGARGKRQQKLLKAAGKPLAAVGRQLTKAVRRGDLTGEAADAVRAALAQAVEAVRGSLTT